MGGIYFLSAQSNLVLPVELWWSGALSWIAHFTEYAVLASLLWLALRWSPRLTRRATAIAFALVALYALFDEVHQSLSQDACRMSAIGSWTWRVQPWHSGCCLVPAPRAQENISGPGGPFPPHWRCSSPTFREDLVLQKS